MRATARMSALAFLRAVANRLVLASSSAVLSRFLLALVRAVVRVSAVAYQGGGTQVSRVRWVVIRVYSPID